MILKPQLLAELLHKWLKTIFWKKSKNFLEIILWISKKVLHLPLFYQCWSNLDWDLMKIFENTLKCHYCKTITPIRQKIGAVGTEKCCTTVLVSSSMGWAQWRTFPIVNRPPKAKSCNLPPPPPGEARPPLSGRGEGVLEYS